LAAGADELISDLSDFLKGVGFNTSFLDEYSKKENPW